MKTNSGYSRQICENYLIIFFKVVLHKESLMLTKNDQEFIM